MNFTPILGFYINTLMLVTYLSMQVSKLHLSLVNDSVNYGLNFNWELKQDRTAAYAVQGHRARMEDRFVVNEDINNTGVSLFAIFDGHGGEVMIHLLYYFVELLYLLYYC